MTILYIAGFTGRMSQNGLTAYATLADIATPTVPHATYRDTLLVEYASSVYAAQLTLPDNFNGYIFYHTTQVGIDVDFDGVTRLTFDIINGIVGVMPVKGVAFSLDFPLVLTSDHASASTGASVTAELSKDGASFVAANNVVTEIGSGFYTISLDAAEMAYDRITLKFTAASTDTRFLTIYTQS